MYDVFSWLYHTVENNKGMAGLLAIAVILHLPRPEDLPRLSGLSPKALVLWAGDWWRCVYGTTRDSLQAYVNRPAKKE